jgi:acetyl esterase/lipase
MMRRFGVVTGFTIAILMGGAMMMALQQSAQTAAPAAGTAPAAKGIAPVPVLMLLWPAGAPEAQGVADDDKPTISAYLPASNPTRTAVVIAPGGGYQHLSMVHEGSEVAEWLNAHGVAAFVLKYRLGPKYHHPIELGDAQRAIRTVRARAAEFGVAPDHIGMWGFSAGGHLTASAGTHFDAGNLTTTDVIERASSRPDFLVLAYPVITLEDPYAHKGSRQYLLGPTPAQSDVDAMSDELHVTAETPPTFLFTTTDDHTVPVMNSVMFYEALVKAGIPAEMHIFQHGGHGAGLAPTNPQLSPWTDLLIKWMRERGYAAMQ